MAVKPEVKTLNATSVQILNAIRNTATANYRDYIPEAQNTRESVQQIGSIIMNYQSLQNEFLSALVNRIGSVIITSKMYSNPWNTFKKGRLELGETIEEIFVGIAKVFEYDPEVAEREVEKRVIPDVKAAFHTLNFKKFYKTTVQRRDLQQAFLSWDGVTDLITKIIDGIYSAANYDEFNVMKYMLARHILNGNLYPVTVPTVNSDNMKSISSIIKGVSNSLEFMSPLYNKAGVQNYSTKNNQYLIINSKFDAVMDIEVLAGAFNMSKAEFEGHRILIDSFGTLDNKRLEQVFADDPNYEPIPTEELKALDAVPAVVVDADWFMVYDVMEEFNDRYNEQGLYWNYWYHTWKIFSVSPFANAISYVPGTPAVSKVTVSPAAVTVAKGQGVQLSAVVDTENFAPQEVNWASSDDNKAKVDIYGRVTVFDTASGTVDITATSAFDSSKSAKCTVTIS